MHDDEMAEGAGAYTVGRMNSAIKVISQDASLRADAKKVWCNRIRAYYTSMKVSGSEES